MPFRSLITLFCSCEIFGQISRRQMFLTGLFLSITSFLPSLISADTNVFRIDKGIPVSYFGRVLTHPGLKIGVSSTLLGCDTSGIASTKVQLSAGMYYHQNNQYAYFGIVEINPALSFCKTWFVSLPIGIGYMRTFLDGKVYSVDNSGNVSRKYLVGSNYLMPSAGLSVGSRLRGMKVGRIYLTLGCFGQYPYNSYMLPNIYCDIGITWQRK